MKNYLSLVCIAVLFALTSCNSNKTTTAESDSLAETQADNTTYRVIPGNYVDLNTGKEVYIVSDPETGYAIDSITRVPIEFYINTSSNDTIFRTGAVVNYEIVNTEGKWKLSDGAKIKYDGDEMKIKDGDYKMKVDGDDSKIKDGTTKTKVDDGEVKMTIKAESSKLKAQS